MEDASYLMVVLITTMFSMCQVGFVIGPKIREVFHEKHQAYSTHRISFDRGTTYVSGITPSSDDLPLPLSNAELADQNAALLARLDSLDQQIREMRKSSQNEDSPIIPNSYDGTDYCIPCRTSPQRNVHEPFCAGEDRQTFVPQTLVYIPQNIRCTDVASPDARLNPRWFGPQGSHTQYCTQCMP
jgi:hypothetical protein